MSFLSSSKSTTEENIVSTLKKDKFLRKPKRTSSYIKLTKKKADIIYCNSKGPLGENLGVGTTKSIRRIVMAKKGKINEL